MTTNASKSVREIMGQATGVDSTTEGVAGYSVDDRLPSVVVFSNSIQQLSEIMAAAWDADLAVVPWGGGTRVTLGNPISRLDVVVDLSRMGRVVEHNPADLTTTVQAGITIADLQMVLGEQGQFLALDPPLPDQATVGGTLAASVSGPLKWQFGNPRDLVIGMKVVQANGKITKSGGQVVKNVSGYDMARLHIGGLGTLGIIAEVSFKLTPLPRNETTLIAIFETSQQCIHAGLEIFGSNFLPLALVSFDRVVNERAQIADAVGTHLLAIRLGGRPRTLERQIDECRVLCHNQRAITVYDLDEDSANATWRRIADFGWDSKTAPLAIGRVSMRPNRITQLTAHFEKSFLTDDLHPAVITHPGYGTAMINWFDDGNDVSSDSLTNTLRRTLDAVGQLGGRMVIERCPAYVKSQFDVWGDVGEPLTIMRRMKEQYDPKGIINPGRFVGGI